MAIQKSYETAFGVSLPEAYWMINNTRIEKPSSFVVVEMAIFRDAQARQQGFSYAATEAFRLDRESFASVIQNGFSAIYEALKKTNGDADGEKLVAAAKGLKWDSPRGPMSIDPETRDVVQTVYIRRVENVGGNLVNVEFDKIENVKDPWKTRMPK